MPWTNAFLAHPGWIPFVRLTYGAYLLHPLAWNFANEQAKGYNSFKF